MPSKMINGEDKMDVTAMDKYFHQNLQQDNRPPDRDSIHRQKDRQLRIVQELRRRVAADKQVATTHQPPLLTKNSA